jgi:hypothetical protein
MTSKRVMRKQEKIKRNLPKKVIQEKPVLRLSFRFIKARMPLCILF